MYGNEERLDKSNFRVEITLAQKWFYFLNKIINLTKKEKITHYKPVIWGEINGGFGKAKFDALSILIYSGKISSIY